MALLFANNAVSTLALPAAPSDVMLTLASGTGDLFPQPSGGNTFPVTLSDAATGLIREICSCTARAGDVLTVVRGQEGTTPLQWQAGDAAANLITAGTLAALQQSAGVPLAPFYAAVSGAGPYATPPYNPANVVLFLDGSAQPRSAYTYSATSLAGTLNLLADPDNYLNLLLIG